MHDPLISRSLLADLRLAHGVFNLAVLLLFLEQARLGLKIRRARQAGAPSPFSAIRRHRRQGPVFAALVAAGYIFGLVLVLLDTGRVLEYPAHLAVGTGLVLLAGLNIFLSSRIKGRESAYRPRHFAAGIVFLSVFVVQVLLGIGVLF